MGAVDDDPQPGQRLRVLASRCATYRAPASGSSRTRPIAAPVGRVRPVEALLDGQLEGVGQLVAAAAKA